MRSNPPASCSTYRKFSIVRLALRKLGYSGICMNGWCFSFQVFSDNGCHRQILNLQVLCSNFEKGCEWTGPLSEIEVSLVCILVYPRVASSFVTLVDQRSSLGFLGVISITHSILQRSHWRINKFLFFIYIYTIQFGVHRSQLVMSFPWSKGIS